MFVSNDIFDLPFDLYLCVVIVPILLTLSANVAGDEIISSILSRLSLLKLLGCIIMVSYYWKY